MLHRHGQNYIFQVHIFPSCTTTCAHGEQVKPHLVFTKVIFFTPTCISPYAWQSEGLVLALSLPAGKTPLRKGVTPSCITDSSISSLSSSASMSPLNVSLVCFSSSLSSNSSTSLSLAFDCLLICICKQRYIQMLLVLQLQTAHNNNINNNNITTK